MAIAARLPGIQFETPVLPPGDTLPRMDIAAFVGFSASGPLNLPVVVEDIPQFEEVFGSDLAIARDPTSTQPLYAYLAPAVRAFFRNGGRRCWVVRVAGAGAVVNRFAIPGLAGIDGAALVPALAGARSEGSWSDGYAVSAALRSTAIEVTEFDLSTNSLALLLARSDDAVPGDLLRLDLPGDGTWWLFADSVTGQPAQSPLRTSNRGRAVIVTGAHSFFQPSLSSPLASSVSLLPTCERVTMDLFVQDDREGAWSLTELGFSPLHPRYWASLPNDTLLYTGAEWEGLWRDAAHPRFPLAGPSFFSNTPVSITPRYFLPTGLEPLTAPFSGANIPDGDALLRNGLNRFDASLFLDPALTGTLAADLMSEADYIRYQATGTRSLTGIHALLGTEEASLIAVPDAVHRGWTRDEETPLASPPASAPVGHPEWWHFLDCAARLSIPLADELPLGQFEPCDLKIIAAPEFSSVTLEGGRLTLEWLPLASAVDFLEESIDPLFNSAAVIYQGASGSVTLFGKPPGAYYYRLRRNVGEVSSNYSQGVAIRFAPATEAVILPSILYDDRPALDVQRALLRICAARGDLFAVLSLPGHYGPAEALAHAAQLKEFGTREGIVPAMDSSESSAFSFAGIYHPWLTGREEDSLNSLRNTPPEGAIIGTFARRASDRGAWIAPANQPLHGVPALMPSIPPEYRQALQDAAINLIRQEPGGFLCLSAATLSDDADLCLINVRRLLSLLRKTALREGVNYVFEPNGDEFRRSVQRGFEKVLNRLFIRGAFAGRTSREAFQVVTDPSLNTRIAGDEGRFYVELRVAPSIPLHFLTIRLLQAADRAFVTEGK